MSQEITAMLSMLLGDKNNGTARANSNTMNFALQRCEGYDFAPNSIESWTLRLLKPLRRYSH